MRHPTKDAWVQDEDRRDSAAGASTAPTPGPMTGPAPAAPTPAPATIFQRCISGERHEVPGPLTLGGPDPTPAYYTDLYSEAPRTLTNQTDALLNAALADEGWWGELGTGTDANLLSARFFAHEGAPETVPGVNSATLFYYPRIPCPHAPVVACTGPHLESLNFWAINGVVQGSDLYLQPMCGGEAAQEMLREACGGAWHRVMQMSTPELYTRAGIRYCFSRRDADRDGPIITLLPPGSFHTFSESYMKRERPSFHFSLGTRTIHDLKLCLKVAAVLPLLLELIIYSSINPLPFPQTHVRPPPPPPPQSRTRAPSSSPTTPCPRASSPCPWTRHWPR